MVNPRGTGRNFDRATRIRQIHMIVSVDPLASDDREILMPGII